MTVIVGMSNIKIIILTKPIGYPKQEKQSTCVRTPQSCQNYLATQDCSNALKHHIYTSVKDRYNKRESMHCQVCMHASAFVQVYCVKDKDFRIQNIETVNPHQFIVLGSETV